MIGELRQLSGLDPIAQTEAAGGVSEITSSLASGQHLPDQRRRFAGSSADVGLGTDSATGPLGISPTGQSVRTSAYLRSVARLGVQAAEALEHAHQQGIVHRDIKPSNLLLDTQGHLWIADFGLAHCQTDTTQTLTMPGDLLGTIRYMSPEKALAKRVVIDHRTDIYSLGVTLYELLTLEPAFTGQDRQEVLRQIAFEEPRPPRRLDEPILAKPPTPLDRATKWCRRNRPVVVAAVALLVLSVIGLTAGTVLILREQTKTQGAFVHPSYLASVTIERDGKLTSASVGAAQDTPPSRHEPSMSTKTRGCPIEPPKLSGQTTTLRAEPAEPAARCEFDGKAQRLGGQELTQK